MKKLNIGIIGCGAIFRLMHFHVLKKMKNKFTISSVYDINKEAIKNSGIKNVNLSKDVKSILRDPEIDAVFILTPISTHVKYTIDALSNNKHVFLEKPAALSIKEIDLMIKVSNKYRRYVQVGMVLRHSNWFLKLKKIIDLNKYGKVLWMHWLETRPLDPMNWRYDSANNNGDAVINDKAVHQINLFNAIAGAKPKSVAAFAGQYLLNKSKSKKLRAFNGEVFLSGDSNDHLMSIIEYENGVKADLLISYVSPYARESRWVIQLEKAKIVTHFETFVKGKKDKLFQWGTNPSSIYIFKDDNKYSVPWKIPMSYPPSTDNLAFYDENKNDPLHPGSTRQLNEFYNCVTKGVKPVCSLELARKDTEVTEALERSIKYSKIVYV